MKDKGILLNPESGDLDIKPIRDSSGKIKSGIIIGDVTKQNRAIILTMHMGEFKGAPTVGVGISSMLLSHEMLLYKHKIREQIEADGQRISYLEMSTTPNNKTKIVINASYK